MLLLKLSFDTFLLQEKLCPSAKLVLTRVAKETKLALSKIRWSLCLTWTVYMLGDLCQHLVSYIRVFFVDKVDVLGRDSPDKESD